MRSPCISEAALLIAATALLCRAHAEPPTERRGPPALPKEAVEEERLPPDEPPFLEEDYQRLPPGVELRPDGSMFKDGVFLGKLAADSPQRRKMRRVHQLASRWAPEFLYIGDWQLFAPYKLGDLATFSGPQQRLTGVAAPPAGDVVVWAEAEERESRLVWRRLDEYKPEQKTVAKATELSPGLWFHQPMSFSPDERWLLATASNGRQDAIASWDDGPEGTLVECATAPADLWLVDCAGLVAPRGIMSSLRLLSVCWSPSGQEAALVACQEGEGEAAVFVLDAEEGRMRRILQTGGRVFWYVDADTLRVYPGDGTPGEVVLYHPSSGQSRRVIEGGTWPRGDEPVWSAEGAKWACVEGAEGQQTIVIGGISERSRKRPVDAAPVRLLGWSSRGEVLAHVAADETLHLSAGVVTDAGYERLMSAMPPGYLERDESRPEAAKSPRQDISLDTTVSPVAVKVSGPLPFGWAETGDGPCLVYADERGRKLKVLRLLRLTLEDLGINPREDLRAQILRQGVENAAYQLTKALIDYAREHGKLPAHPTGLPLEDELRPYLLAHRALRSADDPERVCARVLRPGVTLDDLSDTVRRGGSVRVAEVRDAGMVFGIVAQPPESPALQERVGVLKPLPVSLHWVLEQDLPGAPIQRTE